MENAEKKRPLVLSADDDENAHFFLKRAFGKLALEADLFLLNDGIEVIAYLSGEGEYSDREKYPLPDLLLLDLKMPQVNGLGVLEHIRAGSLPKKFPVFLFTSSVAEQDIRRAYDLGCDGYVVKPSSLDALVDLVRVLDEEQLRKDQKPAPGEASKLSRFIVPKKVESPDAFLKATEGEAYVSTQKPQAPDLFRLLVEQVKDYAIFMLDPEGHILSWNDGARRIKGYEAADVIGKHFSIFYPQLDRDNEKPKFELRMAREMGRYEEEGWRIRKDGSRFWANVVVTPLYEKSGELRGFAKVTRDLTQRKIHEDNMQRLLETEERFRLLVEQVKDYAIFMLDARGNIASWNQGARRVKGYSADEVIGKHFSIFYTPADIARDHPNNELGIAIREGRYEEEGWRVKKDGSRFWASIVITSLWDKRGNLTGFAKVTRDLTQKKMQEDALHKKTEELEAFAHTLSHDLRSPLRAICSYAQVLQEEAKGLKGLEKSYLQKIIGAAESMEMLIDGILKLSWVSLAPASETPVALEQILEEALTLHEAEFNKVSARVKIRKPLPMVIANRTLLLQIFSNLLANAVKFVPKGRVPEVEIRGCEQGDVYEVHIRDNGSGIPESLQATIFTMFNRGEADAKTPGSGIGLAIVKRAAERLGATVIVNSTPGEGSDFIIRLPQSLVLSEAVTAPVEQRAAPAE